MTPRKPDLTGMGRRHVSADVAPRGGMYAVNTSDDARNDVIAFLEVQAHASGLVGQADQAVIQLDTFRRYRGGKETLKSPAMKCQERRAHLLPVPLSYWMGPEEPTILPAAKLKSWRHIRDLCQIDTKNLQQTSRITANRDPGPDFPKFSVLLENLHRYRLLQQTRCKRKATYAPTNNGNVTLAGHICCSPRYRPGTGPGLGPAQSYARC